MELIGLARPYAKAIFSLADNSQELAAWGKVFSALVQITTDAQVVSYIKQPQLNSQEKAASIIGLAGDLLNPQAKNLINVLAANKRLLLVPHIAQVFEQLCDNASNSAQAVITSAHQLEQKQLDDLEQQLKNLFAKENISITPSIDKDLLGGVVVKVGDLIIDNSVRGRIAQLRKQIDS
jgi:F-type H+-transporting ATPase subunit delta